MFGFCDPWFVGKEMQLPQYDSTPWRLALVKTDRFWHEVFLSRTVMQKKSLDNTRLIMIYNKNKKVLGDFDTKIHATKSHMASLYSVKITMKTTAQFSTMNNYAVYVAAWVVEFRTY